MVAQVYVDDIIFGSTKDELAHGFSKLMQVEFEMSMIGKLTHFLGLQIRQQDSSIFLSQSKYAKNLVKKFGLESTSSVRTPMRPNVKLTVDVLGKSVDPSLYRSMIGSLLYLTTSRPDISYSVGVCARYQANPKESHMTALKRIIKYVKTTAEFGVWYSKDTNDVLAGYSDTDWAGNADDRKSTSGGCFYVGNNLVSWMSKKQNSISLSTAEVEYIAASNCCTQLLWMQKLLHDYGWTKLEAEKSTWDKAALAAANANSKALNAIFDGMSPDEFHMISHVTVAKEAWKILETTYEGTKKVKDTKLQMLTTKFEELKMGDDEPFDSFYGKLNEIVIAKLNLDEKIEDTKVVRKILRSLPESF
ncbi:uncharacterized mitochondrial protein AtMg00810-like [Quercus suber]|uniref:uncharacterized mitochondrial protein AtMg00810-like n=1 Tax=Quercus suber TaxID=58331 RepID=UPI0032DFBB70